MRDEVNTGGCVGGGGVGGSSVYVQRRMESRRRGRGGTQIWGLSRRWWWWRRGNMILGGGGGGLYDKWMEFGGWGYTACSSEAANTARVRGQGSKKRGGGLRLIIDYIRL